MDTDDDEMAMLGNRLASVLSRSTAMGFDTSSLLAEALSRAIAEHTGGMTSLGMEVNITTGPDGNVTFSQTGNLPKHIPAGEVDPEVMKALQTVLDLQERLKEEAKKLPSLHEKARELTVSIRREPNFIQQNLWDLFPDRMGESGLVLEKKGGVVFLCQHGEQLDDEVPQDEAQAIMERLEKVDENRVELRVVKDEIDRIKTLIETKRPLMRQLHEIAMETMQEKHPEWADNFFGLSLNGDGFDIVVTEAVNKQGFDVKPADLPADIRGVMAAENTGPSLPGPFAKLLERFRPGHKNRELKAPENASPETGAPEAE
ncbi:MAG: hypothetical protein ABIC19_03670 [Patescibacteria group bacterium]